MNAYNATFFISSIFEKMLEVGLCLEMFRGLVYNVNAKIVASVAVVLTVFVHILDVKLIMSNAVQILSKVSKGST